MTKKADLIINNTIILGGVYDKVSTMKYYIQPCRDPKTGLYPSCVKKVNSNGDMIMSERERNDMSEGRAAFFPEDHVFVVTPGKKYDLDNIYDAAEWECIKNCRLIAKSRDERDSNGNFVIDGEVAVNKVFEANSKPKTNGVAELYIDRPGLETQRRVSRKQLIFKAQSYIYNDELGVQGQLNKALLLGKDMSNQPATDVLDYLLRVAEKEPERIINIYTGTDSQLRLLFIEARKKKVIRIQNKLYMYADDVVLGATDDAVIQWMKEPRNKKMLELIQKDTFPEYFETEE